MKILYYNWLQFDNKKNCGGGVNIYQKNLIEYLIKNTEHEIYFLSSGFKYNPFCDKPYIKETENIYKDKCKTYEVINSSIMAPAYTIFKNPKLFFEDNISYKIFDEFIQKHGYFDVIHFNNIEGISINVLKLKEKYPNTKFIVSIHNYQLICPLVNYFQNHNKVICNNFNNGQECLKCPTFNIKKREYCKHCLNYFSDLKIYNKLFSPIFKLISIFFKYKGKKFIGSRETSKPDYYVLYRKSNINLLNKYADTILAVSKRVREIMLEHGTEDKKIIVSYIGTKIAENELKHSNAKVNKPFTISYLGYERIDKGFFFLIEALSKIDKEIAKNINLVFAVKNMRNENYENKLKNFNNVIVYNGYNHDELPNILKDVNLGIIPVIWEDNLPQVAIEMVALGVPILCSDFGGASELCKSDIFKFKGGNEIDFINKLKLIVQNPDILDEYWKNHPPLTTMKKHIEELERIYGN